MATTPDQAGGFSLASLMMFVTLVSVVLGVSTLWPGAGIPLGVVAFLVWVRTANVVRVRAARGMNMTMVEEVQMFLGSFGVAVTMIVLVLVSCCAALCAACFVAFGSMGLESEAIGIGVIAALVAGIGIFATVKLSQFSRRRWRQQIGEQD